MRILITGATGKFGPLLVKNLLAAGHAVRVLVHSSPCPIPGIESMTGDITRPDDVSRACEGVEAVCHLATVKGDREKFLPVNLGGLFNFLEHLRSRRLSFHLIHLSGDNVLPIYDYEAQGPMDEKTPYLFVDETYGLSKVLEEVMTLQYIKKYDLPVTLLRSSWIMEGKRILTLCDPSKYGMKDYLPPPLKEKLQKKEPFRIVPYDKNNRPLRRSVVDPRDLASAFVKTIGNRKSFGKLYHIAGTAFSYNDLAEYQTNKDGLPIHRVNVPDAHSFEIDTRKSEEIGYTPAYTVFDTVDWALAGNP